MATAPPPGHGAEALDLERRPRGVSDPEQTIGDKPLAYLDSGASSQRVLASIEAVDRYERRHHSNVHRGSHTLSAEATAAYEGARATVADHIGAADRRELIFVRNATEAINLVARAWGAANVGAGDRIVLTEMEHHSNIVPWQQLAESRRRDDRLGRRRRRRRCSTATSSRRLLERDRRSSSPSTHLSNVLGTLNPIAEIARDWPTTPARWSSSTAPRRCRSWRSTSASSASTSTPSPATRPTARPGSARSGRRLELLRGDAALPRRRLDDPQGHQGGHTFADPPARFEAGTPAIAQAIGLAAALRWLDARRDGRGPRPRARDHRLRARAPRRGSRAAGLRPPARRSGSARSPSSSRGSTPTTSPRSSTATGSPFAPATTARSR